MFDIGFAELLIIMVVGLLVLGPDQLPSAVRTAGLWFGRFKRGMSDIRSDLEKEIGADEIRQQLNEERILKDLEKSKSSLNDIKDTLSDDLKSDLGKLDMMDASGGSTAPKQSSSRTEEDK